MWYLQFRTELSFLGLSINLSVCLEHIEELGRLKMKVFMYFFTTTYSYIANIIVFNSQRK